MDRLPAGGEHTTAPRLLLRADAIWPGPDGAAVRPGRLAIEGERMIELGARPAPADAEIVDLPGCTLLPGLIDMHGHARINQRRGDIEIWLIHPYERTLTAWRRRPDGGYDQTTVTEGIIRPVALPGVAIDFAALFE